MGKPETRSATRLRRAIAAKHAADAALVDARAHRGQIKDEFKLAMLRAKAAETVVEHHNEMVAIASDNKESAAADVRDAHHDFNSVQETAINTEKRATRSDTKLGRTIADARARLDQADNELKVVMLRAQARRKEARLRRREANTATRRRKSARADVKAAHEKVARTQANLLAAAAARDRPLDAIDFGSSAL
jgi:hypothetical protein